MNIKLNRLTIIITYYFQKDIVEEVLLKLYKQAKSLKTNIEVLVVDSKTDARKLSIKRYQNKNSYINVKILNTENSPSKKRNLGIKKSLSDYLIFLDDDVIPCNNFLYSFLELARQKDASMTSCLVNFDKPKNSYLYYRMKKESSVQWNKLSPKKFIPIYCTSMAFGSPKSLIMENLHFFDENFKGYGWEDIDYFINAANKGIKLNFANIPVIHRELYSYKKYFKKQQLMGSWYKYFLDKHPIHGKKMKIYIIYKYLFIFKYFLPLLKGFFNCVEFLFAFKLPFNFFTYLIYECYFKFANILGMLTNPIEYENKY